MIRMRRWQMVDRKVKSIDVGGLINPALEISTLKLGEAHIGDLPKSTATGAPCRRLQCGFVRFPKTLGSESGPGQARATGSIAPVEAHTGIGDRLVIARILINASLWPRSLSTQSSISAEYCST